MPAHPPRSSWALRLHVAFDAVHAADVLRACSDMLAAAPEALRAEASMVRRLRTVATPLLDRTAPVEVR